VIKEMSTVDTSMVNNCLFIYQDKQRKDQLSCIIVDKRYVMFEYNFLDINIEVMLK